jgi:hypothetical protein
MRAPVRSVTRRPKMSPTRPASSEVTVGFQQSVSGVGPGGGRRLAHQRLQSLQGNVLARYGGRGGKGAPRMATIVPISYLSGAWKYAMKYGPVKMPDMTPWS